MSCGVPPRCRARSSTYPVTCPADSPAGGAARLPADTPAPGRRPARSSRSGIRRPGALAGTAGHLAGQVRGGQAPASQPPAQIRQPLHMISDRVQRIAPPGQIPAQALSERLQRPGHHEPPRPPGKVTRTH